MDEVGAKTRSDDPADGGKRGLFETTRHPLVVLAASVVLGSLAVPLIRSFIDRQEREAQERHDRAIAILDSANAVERDLNTLMTEFEHFFKTERFQETGFNAKETWTDFRRSVWGHYQDFDQRAWWWWRDELQRISVLGLVKDESLERMYSTCEEYNRSLVQSAQALDPLWALVASPSSDSRAGDVTLQAVGDARIQLADHAEDRRQLISRLIEELRN